MKTLVKCSLVFFLALILNLIWEKLHSVLYLHYKGGEITDLILLKAAMVDALIILVLILCSQLFKPSWLFILLTGIVVAILIEYMAFFTQRWTYNSSMPIIPIINVGLTPTIQLALLGLAVYFLVFRRNKRAKL